MAAKKNADDDLGTCDNHPEVPAVHKTDGVKFEIKRLCKPCLDRWQHALIPGRRRPRG